MSEYEIKEYDSKVDKDKIVGILAFGIKRAIISSREVLSRENHKNDSPKQRAGIFVTALRRELESLSSWEELDEEIKRKYKAVWFSTNFWTDVAISRLTPVILDSEE